MTTMSQWLKIFFFSLVSQAQENITGEQAIDKDAMIIFLLQIWPFTVIVSCVVWMQLSLMIYICMLHAKYVFNKVFFFFILYDNCSFFIFYLPLL